MVCSDLIILRQSYEKKRKIEPFWEKSFFACYQELKEGALRAPS
jgi:hypothetical protein